MDYDAGAFYGIFSMCKLKSCLEKVPVKVANHSKNKIVKKMPATKIMITV